MSDLNQYIPRPGLYVFHSFGAGPTLALEFMRDGRLQVTGPAPDEGSNILYMVHEASKHFLSELLNIPFENFEPDEARHEDCLVV